MKTYKAPDDSLHVIEPEFSYLLPTGCIEITEEEAQIIREANAPTLPTLTPQEQIDVIERDTMMNRATREFMLMMLEREIAREHEVDLTIPGNLELVQAGLYANNHAYKRVKDIDNQIIALRALIV